MPVPNDVVITVEGVSKKFCRSLRRSMIYGAKDVALDLLGIHRTSNGLRPDEFWALDGVSFDVKRGECLGLIGPNGAGKSTLLKMLTGLMLPGKGTIRVRGHMGALLELGAGFHPMLTGRENIYLAGAILGLSKKQIENKFREIVDFAELWEFIDSPVKHYSSGMYLRLGFAVAVHAEPEILLVDEALAVGDVLFQTKCYAKLREFKERRTTIIFVTHSLDLVTSHCSRAVLLDRGALVCEDTPKAVVDQYNRLIALKSALPQGGTKNGKDGLSQPVPSKEIEWSGLFHLNPNEDRYGSRRAEILGAGIFTRDNSPSQILRRNEEYVIKIKVRHNESMQAPIVAYTVKDLRGTVLCGTNTHFQDVDMGWMQQGEVILITFRQVIRLNPGDFLLCVGCGTFERGEYVIYDRRFDYMPFQVISNQPRAGIFDSDPVIDWTRI